MFSSLRSLTVTNTTAYLKIARPDHWFKNVFAVPGIILALYYDPGLLNWILLPKLLLAFLSICLLASSNYVINEIVDAPLDKHHPDKRHRPIPSGQVNILVAYGEWILLALAGLCLAIKVNFGFFLCAFTFVTMGMAYNIPPVRLKDIPYLDVLSESANNPIRFVLGWFAAGNSIIIPISVILSYWMFGAFLMAVKRYAEYNYIDNPERAENYRKSFGYYDKNRLLTSIIYYATAFGLFLGLFIMRYRIELIMGIPFVAGFIAYYLRLGFRYNSPVQYPEKLFKVRPFFLYTLVCFFVLSILLFMDIPYMYVLFMIR